MRALLAAVLLLAPAAPQPLFRLADPRLDEVSGIAAGIASPGVFYVQNDSGDSARFFALDADSGAVLAEYDVPDATNVDWEDIAVARDADRTPSVWLADIGDNDGERDQIEVYKVPEPRVDLTRRDQVVRTEPPQVWRLRYPDHARNAEALAVSSVGVPYVITKSLLGATVYRAPPTPGPAALQPIASLPIRLATGADWSGRTFVIRNYTTAFVWQVRGDLATSLRAEPDSVELPAQRQGEGMCVDGDRLVIDSEGVGTTVYAVPLPPSTSTSIATGASRAGAAPASGSRTASAPASRRQTFPWWTVAVGSGVLVAVAALALRRRHPH